MVQSVLSLLSSRNSLVIILLVASLSLLGCSTNDTSRVSATGAAGLTGEGTESHLRVGDELQIRIDTGGGSGSVGQIAPQTPQTLDVVIDENGEIALPLINRIKAGGSTPSEVAERIQANYVPRFYVRCNASVLVAVRFFYVGGEVRAPGRYNWNEDVTLLKAINTAGSFTDYANRGKVEIVRGKTKTAVNYEQLRRNPSQDVPIRPGDSIWVPRSIF